MTALHRRLACALALALPGSVVAACAAPPAVRPAVADGRASIQATARVGTAGRRLRSVVQVYGPNDVDVVELRLFAVAGATETLLVTVDIPAGYFAIPATFSRLRANSAYRLRARAYRPGGRTLADQISDDAASFVNVATGDDDRATWAACPVRLIDKPFDAQAVGGVTFTDGGLTPDLRGLVLTLAGGLSGMVEDQGPLARFNQPAAVAFDGGTGGFWVADAGNHRIRFVDADGNTTTFSGTGIPGLIDNPAGTARFNNPRGLGFNGETVLLVADTGNHAVRILDPLDGAVTTMAGNGPGFADDPNGLAAQFNAPEGVVVDGSDAFVADTGNHRIRFIDGAGPHPVTTIAGGAGAAHVDAALGANARFSGPAGLVLGWPYLYVADTGNHSIRRITMDDPNHPVTTIAGDGTPGDADGAGASARFNGPRGLAIDNDYLFVVDTGNHRIRAVDLNDGGTFAVHTVAGDAFSGSTDGLGASGKFNAPCGIAIDGGDGSLVIADTDNHRVRRVR